MTQRLRVAVAGAGVFGLACALELAKAGLPMVDEHFGDAKHDLGR